jgi:hypothetical protein
MKTNMEMYPELLRSLRDSSTQHDMYLVSISHMQRQTYGKESTGLCLLGERDDFENATQPDLRKRLFTLQEN